MLGALSKSLVEQANADNTRKIYENLPDLLL